MMGSKNIVLYETYDGVRFVLERSLSKLSQSINIFSSHWKNEVKEILHNKDVDLLITELNQENPNGLEVSAFARKISPELSIIWIWFFSLIEFCSDSLPVGKVGI